MKSLTEVLDELRKAKDRKPPMTSYRLDRIDLVDATHAWTYVYVDDDSVPRSVAWVRSVEPATSVEKWYLYTEATDGAWPQTPASPAAPAGAPPPNPGSPPPDAKPQALSPEETEEVQRLVAKVHPYFQPSKYGKVGETLFITLDYGQYTRAEVLRSQVTDDAIQLVRRMYGDTKGWSGVRLEFRCLWQNPMGAREMRPLVVVGLTRAVHNGIHFENLDASEVFALFPPPRDWIGQPSGGRSP